MKTFALSAVFGAASALLGADDFEFINYVAKWNKAYETVSEYNDRMVLWKQKDDIINAHNADETQTHKLGHNNMSDWAHHEYKQLLGYIQDDNKPYNPVPFVKSNSDGINWVEKGGVTDVKNQGSCGSCWAFSSTGAVEGCHFNATGNLVPMSEQQLVSCDKGILTNHGCNGGLMDNSFKYLKTVGLNTEANYPYTSGGGSVAACDKDLEAAGTVMVSEYVDVQKESSDALKAQLDKGPVSVAIEADKATFQQYSTGVITGTACGTSLDHGVLAVGYGTENGQGYFLVKNSWGAEWGDNGYVKIGDTDGAGVCGILSGPPSQPTSCN